MRTTPGRRRGDPIDPDTPTAFLIRHWSIIVVLLTWIVLGTAAFIHLEDHISAQDGRMNFHWGQEW